MTEIPLILNPDGVASPGNIAARDASEIVRFAFQAISHSDLSVPPRVPGNPIAYDLGSGASSAEARRLLYENWILVRAFSELARGIRATLEEAFFFIRVAAIPNGPIKAHALDGLLADIRTNAGRASFPKLMEAVTAGLTEPLTFAAEFQSLQRVRNCLEHRGGIVGQQDADENGNLTLTMPRIKVFYMRAGEEVELAIGAQVDPGDDRKEVVLLSKRETRARVYVIGERITFTADEFQEIAFACVLFISDLVTKLPKLSPPPVRSSMTGPPTTA